MARRLGGLRHRVLEKCLRRPGREHGVEKSETGIPVGRVGEALDEERIQDPLGRYGSADELVERHTDECPRCEGIEVDLHAERAAGMLGRHLPFVQAGDE